MAAPISPMQLLVSIVERGKGRCLLDHYRQFGLIHHNQAAGHGTAASHLLDTLGFGTSERDVVLTLGPRDTIRQLMNHLKDDDRSKLGAPGIAFALDLSGMSAILAVTLARLEEMRPERGEPIVEQGNHHSLILVSVNQGYTDAGRRRPWGHRHPGPLDRRGGGGEVRGYYPPGGEGGTGHCSFQQGAQRYYGGY